MYFSIELEQGQCVAMKAGRAWIAINEIPDSSNSINSYVAAYLPKSNCKLFHIRLDVDYNQTVVDKTSAFAEFTEKQQDYLVTEAKLVFTQMMDGYLVEFDKNSVTMTYDPTAIWEFDNIQFHSDLAEYNPIAVFTMDLVKLRDGNVTRCVGASDHYDLSPRFFAFLKEKILEKFPDVTHWSMYA